MEHVFVASTIDNSGKILSTYQEGPSVTLSSVQVPLELPFWHILRVIILDAEKYFLHVEYNFVRMQLGH